MVASPSLNGLARQLERLESVAADLYRWSCPDRLHGLPDHLLLLPGRPEPPLPCCPTCGEPRPTTVLQLVVVEGV